MYHLFFFILDAKDFNTHPMLGFIVLYSSQRKASLAAVKLVTHILVQNRYIYTCIMLYSVHGENGWHFSGMSIMLTVTNTST